MFLPKYNTSEKCTAVCGQRSALQIFCWGGAGGALHECHTVPGVIRKFGKTIRVYL